MTVEGRAAKALAELDSETIGEELAEHHAVVAYKDGLLSTTATVDAAGPVQALDTLVEILSEVVGTLTLEYGEVMTEERQEQELEISNVPDLVGIAEIAELAKTSRQRVFQMTANKGFPAAVLELRSGRLWSRPAIERYLEGRESHRRPRIKALSSQVGATRVRTFRRK